LIGGGWDLFMKILHRINSTSQSSHVTCKSWVLIALKH
jgi:hypothetical protein